MVTESELDRCITHETGSEFSIRRLLARPDVHLFMRRRRINYTKSWSKLENVGLQVIVCILGCKLDLVMVSEKT